MGIFDTFKKSEKEAKPTKQKASVADAKKEEKKKTEVKKEKVMTPDGRLVEATKKVESKPKKQGAKKEETGEAHRVLMHPMITEKSSYLAVTNQYVFAVAPQTNKVEVRKAIRKVYNVDPIKVNIMNVAGKQVRYGRTEGRTKHWKKAIITLAAGQKIEIQEGL